MTLVPANLFQTLKNIEVADNTIPFNTIIFEKINVMKNLKFCEAQTLVCRTFFENEKAFTVYILSKYETCNT